MQDNFKDYIDRNANEFTFPFDAEKGWKDFESRRPKKRFNPYVWLVAASVTLLLMVGVAWVYYPAEEPQPLTEWQEAELFYQQQIDDMTLMVKRVTDDEEILYDLDEMDRAFAELKNDLKDNADNAEVIEAMMNHYRLKLQILEQMLEEIQETNESKEDTIRL